MNKESIEKLKEAFIRFNDLWREYSINSSDGEVNPFCDSMNTELSIEKQPLKMLNIFLMDHYGINPLTKQEVDDFAFYLFELTFKEQQIENN